MSEEKIEKNLQGLRGWLILVGIGIVLGPIKNVVLLIPMYKKMFFI